MRGVGFWFRRRRVVLFGFIDAVRRVSGRAGGWRFVFWDDVGFVLFFFFLGS